LLEKNIPNKMLMVNKKIMALITKKEIAELHDINQENCISIFYSDTQGRQKGLATRRCTCPKKPINRG
jgi:hypothetical protein